jgi:N-acetylmuramoyl-L-alanine amidase
MTLLKLTAVVILMVNLLPIKAMAPSDPWEQVNMTEDEFILMSSVVEAESDRSESLDGRILIAVTILNRVESDQFPNTITEVLTQSGQFSTVRNGRSVTGRTELSDQAVIEAVELIESGEAPNVMFFNCVGFFRGFPEYEYVDGNYFSLGTEAEE